MRAKPHMTQGLHDFLAHVALDPESTVVEVGCYRGESTEVWAKAFSKVVAVDSWQFPDQIGSVPEFMEEASKVFGKVTPRPERRDDIDWERIPMIFTDVEQEFDRRMSAYNVVKMKMTSLEAAAAYEEEPADLIYIDANHDHAAVCEDLRAWLPHVRPGGYIGGHNYDAQWPEVVQAIDELMGPPDRIFVDTSWVKHVVDHENMLKT